MDTPKLDSNDIDEIYPLLYVTAAAKKGDLVAKKELAQRLIDREKFKASLSQK
jgi:hypothetical protein